MQAKWALLISLVFLAGCGSQVEHVLVPLPPTTPPPPVSGLARPVIWITEPGGVEAIAPLGGSAFSPVIPVCSLPAGAFSWRGVLYVACTGGATLVELSEQSGEIVGMLSAPLPVGAAAYSWETQTAFFAQYGGGTIMAFHPATDEFSLVGSVPFAVRKLSTAAEGGVLYIYGSQASQVDIDVSGSTPIPLSGIEGSMAGCDADPSNVSLTLCLGSNPDRVYLYTDSGRLLASARFPFTPRFVSEDPYLQELFVQVVQKNAVATMKNFGSRPQILLTPPCPPIADEIGYGGYYAILACTSGNLVYVFDLRDANAVSIFSAEGTVLSFAPELS